jgi:hypothetical protein
MYLKTLWSWAGLLQPIANKAMPRGPNYKPWKITVFYTKMPVLSKICSGIEPLSLAKASESPDRFPNLPKRILHSYAPK